MGKCSRKDARRRRYETPPDLAFSSSSLVDGFSVDGIRSGMDQSLKLTPADLLWEKAQQGRHHLFVRGHVPDTIEWANICEDGVHPFVGFPSGIKNPVSDGILLIDPRDVHSNPPLA
ncbi:MAG: hypothetical protein C7B46_05525 [Sulfobacillus benefaciens]|uniref:Uncharacterized protein n=1 Tax=Sulfobacillus benefaciens TaxID=453960 RepID=A0A2T2XIW2_9FIRM|nr:MAG: hypothetical protein C7B46_05525 [Sulfobacillus benefaciens]